MGSGGGARGRDFEERAGAYARTYGFFPIAASVCRHVCVSMRKRSLKDVAQDVAENLLGAAEDGGVKVLIVVFSLSSSGGTHAQQTHANPPRCPWATREGRAHEGRGAGRKREGFYLARRHLSAAWVFWSTRWSRPAEPRALPERCTTRAMPNLRSFNLEVSPRTRKAGPERALRDPRELFLDSVYVNHQVKARHDLAIGQWGGHRWLARHFSQEG